MQALPENMLQALCAGNPAILTETVSALHRENPGLSPDEIIRLATPLISPENIDFPDLALNPEALTCHIGEVKIFLTPAEFALYWLLSIRSKHRLPPLRGEKNMLDEFRAFIESTSSQVMPEITSNGRFKDIDETGLKAIAENISRKIEVSVEIKKGMVHILPLKGDGIYGISVPAAKIFCPRNY